MDIGIDFGISNIDVAIKIKGEIRFCTFISSDESISDKFHNVIFMLLQDLSTTSPGKDIDMYFSDRKLQQTQLYMKQLLSLGTPNRQDCLFSLGPRLSSLSLDLYLKFKGRNYFPNSSSK